MAKPLRVSEADGRASLCDHARDRAACARERFGPQLDLTAMMRMLEDRTIVRYPTTLVFDTRPLEPGEFAYPQPLGDAPQQGYRLVVHPFFQDRNDALPALMAYHIPVINYGADIVTHEVAEIFGATLLGMTTQAYYQTICQLADSMA